MREPPCSHNPEGTEACVQCASPLRRVCSKCGGENPPEALFCARCANPFPENNSADGQRKTAAAPLASLRRPTGLSPEFAPEVRALIGPALDLMGEASERYRIASLLAHNHEEAGNKSEAMHAHLRASEWASVSDFEAALHHLHQMRALARESDPPESAALTIVACSKALAHGWRLGAKAAEASGR